MATWLDLYPRLATRVIGCPMPTVEAELRNAAEEFFKRTRAWREWLPEVILSENTRRTEIMPPAGAYVVQIEKATRNGRPISVHGAFSLDTPAAIVEGVAGVSSMDRRNVDALFNPQESQVFLALAIGLAINEQSLTSGGYTLLRLQCSLTPTQTAPGLPDYLAEQYGAEIAEGAVHRIRSIPLLADAAMSSVAFEKFERDVARVGALVHRTHTSTTPRRQPHWC